MVIPYQLIVYLEINCLWICIGDSFGMNFDPVTGKLWDKENGPEYGDEINLVEPRFYSEWKKVQGT